MNATGKCVAAAAAAWLFVSAAQAKTCVWTGQGQLVNNSLQLFDAANWEGGAEPEEGDTLEITTQSAAKIAVNKSGYTFANVIYSNAYATDFGPGDFTLTGTESKFTTTGAGKNVYFGVSVTLAEGAKVELCQAEGAAFQVKSGAFSGQGEIVVTGSRAPGASTDATISLDSNPNFHGTWSIYRPVWISGNVNNPFGGDDATVNVYGENGEANTLGKLSFAGNNTVSGEINCFNMASIGVTGLSAVKSSIVTFNGNVTYTAQSASYRQLDISVGINGKEYTSGYVFKKDLCCVTGNKPWMNIYTYSRGTYHFEVRGRFTPSESDRNPFVIGLMQSGAVKKEEQLADVYLGGPVTVGHVWKFVPRSYNHYHMTAPNIMPNGTVRIAWGSSDKATPDSYLDLHGYDQRVAAFQYDNAEVQGFTVQSTDRPATLKVGNNETTAHLVPLLKGKVSIYGYALSANNGAHSFTNVYETSGWIGTERNSLVVEGSARFPNLGGVECTGAGSVIVRSGAEFNSDMSLDVHDMTGGKVRIATGVNLDVRHVFAENVDLPAGVYCRTGAGIEGATEVSWLNKTSNDTDEMKGTVTVAAHDPVWIWTGGGSSTSFTDAANWGANASPDLTNARLTLNLKNAAGAANMVVPLNGTIAPAGAFNCGDYGKDGGAVTFGGAGTLVLGDAGAAETNDLKMVFTESTSFTWNGAGTLYLTGKSTSTGTLTVNSGKVIMDHAGWAGDIVVANGAELVVNTNCGNDVFDAEAEFDLDGKLTLGDRATAGDEIALAVKALRISGVLARHDKPYGSSASAAAVRDDVHLGGTGTIVSSEQSGLMMIFH